MALFDIVALPAKRYVFRPGFSTAPAVDPKSLGVFAGQLKLTHTSQCSGRFFVLIAGNKLRPSSGNAVPLRQLLCICSHPGTPTLTWTASLHGRPPLPTPPACSEGVFQGLPLALSSMRAVLERMDWGSQLDAGQKAQPGGCVGEGAAQGEGCG